MMMKSNVLFLILCRNEERDALSRNLAVLKTRMDQEQEYNKKINKGKQGEVMTYGSSLQLQHLDSGSYL